MKSIVILGAGFGGIKTALTLHRYLKHLRLLSRYEIVVIDRENYQTYTPVLYEAATTSKEIANQIELKSLVTFPLEKIFRRKKITLLKKTVGALDLMSGDVHFSDGDRLKFNYLVLALGSENNFFNIPGLKENALTLKTFIDALQIRDAIWNAVLDNNSGRELQIIIGGGGVSGVEIASEIQSWICELEGELTRCRARVNIIEAAETLLSGFPEKIVRDVQARLGKIEVNTILQEAIAKLEPQKITLKSGRIIPYDIFIWTGGVKAVSLVAALPLKKEPRGRLEVASAMECLPQTPDLKIYGKIYGIGDAICFYDPTTNRPVPLVAEAAMQEGKIAAYNIVQDILQEEKIIKAARHKRYLPLEYPYIIAVGAKYAIAKIGPLVISGFFGWILKGIVELYYLLQILPFWMSIKIWLKGLLVFIKNDRLG